MIDTASLAATLEGVSRDQGLAPFALSTLKASRYGRNENFEGALHDGTKVFVKVFDASGEAERRRRRSIAAGLGLPDDAGVQPRLIGDADDPPLLVFEHVSGTDLMKIPAEDGWSDDDALTVAQCAGVLARLHSEPVTKGVYEPHPLPPVTAMAGVPADVYVTISAAEIHAWRILQGDADLGAALRAMAAADETYASAYIHADVRLDQFLRKDSGDLVLLDWEEFRVGDPARDVGALAGEVLHRSLLRVARPSSRFHEEFSHEQVLTRASAELEAGRPALVALWERYEQTCPVDRAFVERATRFAGWHLFDRLLASAHRASRLPPIALACAGIGRNAVLRPGDFLTSVHPQIESEER